MRTISIDLDLALEYAQAEIARLMSESSSASEILQRIRVASGISVDELPDAELRCLALSLAFDRLRAG
ncbi:hypothetical protein HY626_03740 [Candidatus Uhrbacteria bacterium]|nr:hypothetical protein [Candidatus Uhrbacteria bacterium]